MGYEACITRQEKTGTYISWYMNVFDVPIWYSEIIERMHFTQLIEENHIFHGDIHESTEHLNK